jgi:hypothetical protein
MSKSPRRRRNSTPNAPNVDSGTFSSVNNPRNQLGTDTQRGMRTPTP